MNAMTESRSDGVRPTRPFHPVNIGYLVVGLVFLGVAGVWALHAADLVGTEELGWLLPSILLGAGAVGLAAIAVRRSASVSNGSVYPSVSDSARKIVQSSRASPGANTARSPRWTRPSKFTQVPDFSA